MNLGWEIPFGFRIFPPGVGVKDPQLNISTASTVWWWDLGIPTQLFNEGFVEGSYRLLLLPVSHFHIFTCFLVGKTCSILRAWSQLYNGFTLETNGFYWAHLGLLTQTLGCISNWTFEVSRHCISLAAGAKDLFKPTVAALFIERRCGEWGVISRWAGCSRFRFYIHDEIYIFRFISMWASKKTSLQGKLGKLSKILGKEATAEIFVHQGSILSKRRTELMDFL